VHAVGTVESRLYVAMEFVPGLTFRAWREADKPGWRKIVAMLTAAGEGLAAAHDAGFVHRDFKPENILVGRDGRPRVGDFGLVRASLDGTTTSGIIPALTDEKAREWDEAVTQSDGRGAAAKGGQEALAETMAADSTPPPRRARTASSHPTNPLSSPLSAPLTVTGAALGTPAYMAPEQFVGGDGDARADQFAFCVVLYEALFGHRPWRGSTYQELRAQVTRVDPEPPARGAAPGWLWKVIRRGLARDPAARWPDLRALLAALRAGPRRRNRLALAAAMVAAAGVVVAFLVLRPTHALAPAPSCAQAAAAVDDVWNAEAKRTLTERLTALDPAIGPRKAAVAAGRFERWAGRFRTVAEQACRNERIDHSWSARTGATSRLCLGASLRTVREAIGYASRVEPGRLATYASDLGVLPRVEECVSERALVADFQQPAGAAALAEWRRLRAAHAEIDALRDKEDIAAARARFDAIWPDVERLDFDPLTAQMLTLDGEIARSERRLDVAIDRLERAWTLGRAAGADSIALGAVYWLIWVHAADRHDPTSARPWVLQAVPEAERYGLDHPPAVAVLQAASIAAEIDADYERALALQDRLIAALEPEDDLNLAKAPGNHGASLDGAGRSAEAIEAYRRALAIFERDLGHDDPSYLWVRANLILAQIATGDVEGGLATAVAAVAAHGDGRGLDRQELLNLRFNHAFALQSAGRLDAALAAYRTLRVDQAALSGEDSMDVAYIDANLGDLLLGLGKHDDARGHLEQALRVRQKLLGDDHDEVADVRTNLGKLELDTRGCKKAAPHYQAAVAAYRAIAERGAVLGRGSRAFLGLALCRSGAERTELLTEGRRFAEQGAPDVIAEIDAMLAAP
jgi:tetratricopeptide (TPR) repeat protein